MVAAFSRGLLSCRAYIYIVHFLIYVVYTQGINVTELNTLSRPKPRPHTGLRNRENGS